MSYVEFLLQWYNLPWVAAALAAGVGLAAGRRGPAWIGAFVAGVAGLTLNGGLHDLGIGPIGSKLPLVAAASLACGALAGWGLPRLRRRLLPPVTGVAFNQPGLEGREAIVLSARLEKDGTGRARHRDEAGVSHIVRVHLDPGLDAEAVRFGARVRLGAFDDARLSYPIRPAS